MMNIEHNNSKFVFHPLWPVAVAIIGWPCQQAFGATTRNRAEVAQLSTCFDETIHIKDVADIRTGKLPAADGRWRIWIWINSRHKQTQVEISDRLIQYRLLVAGIDQSQFESSADLPLTIARFSEPINTSQTIEQAIQLQLGGTISAATNFAGSQRQPRKLNP